MNKIFLEHDKKSCVPLGAFVITLSRRESSFAENMVIYADGIASEKFSDCFLIFSLAFSAEKLGDSAWESSA